MMNGIHSFSVAVKLMVHRELIHPSVTMSAQIELHMADFCNFIII